MGEHQGLAYYTLGQRQGLRIGGTRDGGDAPWFVAGKDMARNALVVVQGHDHPLLFAREVQVQEMHWIAGAPPPLPLARTREDALSHGRMRAARVAAHGAGLVATFAQPQWAPTPGQYLVLYDGDVCLGGGVIGTRRRSASRRRAGDARPPDVSDSPECGQDEAPWAAPYTRRTSVRSGDPFAQPHASGHGH